MELQADSSLFQRGIPLDSPEGSGAQPSGVAPIPSPASRHHSTTNGSAVHHVIASELKHRNQASDALAMMVNSMVSMVQAGKASRSRWSAS